MHLLIQIFDFCASNTPNIFINLLFIEIVPINDVALVVYPLIVNPYYTTIDILAEHFLLKCQ